MVIGQLRNKINEPVLVSADLKLEYRNIVPILRDRFKAQLVKADRDMSKLQRLRCEESEQNDEFVDVRDTPCTLTQRAVYMQFLAEYSETHPNLAMLVRIMLVHLTNSAAPERYFSFKNLVYVKTRQLIDADSTY